MLSCEERCSGVVCKIESFPRVLERRLFYLTVYMSLWRLFTSFDITDICPDEIEAADGRLVY
jgi:hypothetical protein